MNNVLTESRSYPVAGRFKNILSPQNDVHSNLISKPGASGIESPDTGQELPPSLGVAVQLSPEEWEEFFPQERHPEFELSVNAVSGADTHAAIADYSCRFADSIASPQLYTQSELVRRIEQDIAEDLEAAQSEDEPAPTTSAIETCRWLAGLIAALISEAPKMKSAAFTQDDGGISLITHSLATQRRVEFCISPGGSAISIVTIDENMRLESDALDKNQPDALRELAKWVIRSR